MVGIIIRYSVRVMHSGGGMTAGRTGKSSPKYKTGRSKISIPGGMEDLNMLVNGHGGRERQTGKTRTRSRYFQAIRQEKSQDVDNQVRKGPNDM